MTHFLRTLLNANKLNTFRENLDFSNALQVLDTCFKIVLVLLCFLELCVSIITVLLGIKALRSEEKPENQVSVAVSALR